MTASKVMNLTEFYAWLADMRATAPVQENELGMIEVFGYPECRTVLSATEHLSSDLDPNLPDPFVGANLVRMDPPEHTNLRRIVGSVLTPKAFDGLESHVRRIADRLLDVAGDNFDFVEDFAGPLPVLTIANLLGLPESDSAQLRRWSDVFRAESVPGQEMNAYFIDHVQRHRSRPRDDMTSRLIAAEVDGYRLSDEVLAAVMGVLLFAGNSTATALLANSMLILDERPGLVEELRAERSLIPSAVEEFLRFFSPFSAVARRAVDGFDLAGVSVREGQWLRIWISSANRDARQFTDPDAVDVHRDPNRHLSLGRGMHFCLGAALGRLEATVVLNRLFDRFAGLRVAEEPKMFDPMIAAAVKNMPVAAGGRSFS